MKRPAVDKRTGLSEILLCLLLVPVLTGCGEENGDFRADPSGPTMPVPTVDMTHALEAFESGGELTFEEVVALKYKLVYSLSDSTSSSEAESDKYFEAIKDFGAKLEECHLKETVGWVGWIQQEHALGGPQIIPDSNRVGVYVYNPFQGVGKELRQNPDLWLLDLTDKEVAQLIYGQRIRFSGNLQLVDFYNDEAIKNARYEILADEPAAPTPSAGEMKDLRVTLDRGECNGACPDYTVTIEADGKVAFNGRHYTKRRGINTSVIDSAKLTELATDIIKADFFSLNESYSAMIADLPTYSLTIRMNRQSKQVTTNVAHPHRLTILMNRIDQIADTAQWIGDETER